MTERPNEATEDASERLAFKLETITADPQIPDLAKFHLGDLVGRYLDEGLISQDNADKIFGSIPPVAGDNFSILPALETDQAPSIRLVREPVPIR